MKLDFTTTSVERLCDSFIFKLNENNISLEGSSRVVLKRGIRTALDTYSPKVIESAIEHFFIDNYAKGTNYSVFLFLKQLNRYTKAPSIYQISINELIHKHFRNEETGRLYEDIEYSENEEELQKIKRIVTGNYGTIFDLSLEDIEKLIAKRVYKRGKEAVPNSWVEAYFNRLKICNTPSVYQKELLYAENKKHQLSILKNKIKLLHNKILKLNDFLLIFSENPSKKIKYMLLKNLKISDKELTQDMINCHSVEEFKKLRENFEKEKKETEIELVAKQEKM